MLRNILPRVWNQCRRNSITQRFYYRHRHLPFWRSSVCDPNGLSRSHPWAWSPFEQFGKNIDRMVEDVFPDKSIFKAAVRRGTRDIEVTYNATKFEMKVDVDRFAPEDLNIKLQGNNLVISGKYKNTKDAHGFISREFTREILLPENVKLDTLESVLTNDGYIILRAQTEPSEKEAERIIEIIKEKAEDITNKEKK